MSEQLTSTNSADPETETTPQVQAETEQEKEQVLEQDQNALDDLGEIEFLLDEIEDQIAPLAL